MDLFGETAEEPLTEEQPSKELVDQEEERLQTCLGFEKIEAHLLELFSNDRLPHGLVLTGIKGIGKSLFTQRFARFLLKHGAADPNQDDMFGDTAAPQNFDVSPDDKVSRLMLQNAHPDLLMIAPEKNNIAVADIRKANPFLRMTASDAGWRIVVIDDADTMNRAAQNALLKILEEPPEKTVILLITHRIGALIPTIRSRTQVLNFSAPSRELFETILTQQGFQLENEQAETLYDLTQGSVGKAIEYIEEGGLDILARILMAFEDYPHQDIPALHVLGEEFARSGQEKSYQSFTELLTWIMCSLVQNKARGLQLNSSILARPAFETLSRQSSLAKLLEICENLEDHFRKVERANLDKRQSVLQAFSILAA